MLTDEIKKQLITEITALLQDNTETTEQPSNFKFADYTNSLTGEPEGWQCSFVFNGQTHSVNISSEGELDGEIVFSNPNDVEEDVEGSTTEGALNTNQEEMKNDLQKETKVEKKNNNTNITENKDLILDKIKTLMASDEYKSLIAQEVEKYMSTFDSKRMGSEKKVEDIKKSVDNESDSTTEIQKNLETDINQIQNENLVTDNIFENKEVKKITTENETVTETEGNNELPTIDQISENETVEYEKAFYNSNPFGLTKTQLAQYFPSLLPKI